MYSYLFYWKNLSLNELCWRHIYHHKKWIFFFSVKLFSIHSHTERWKRENKQLNDFIVEALGMICIIGISPMQWARLVTCCMYYQVLSTEHRRGNRNIIGEFGSVFTALKKTTKESSNFCLLILQQRSTMTNYCLYVVQVTGHRYD